ncbi:sensor histidine kinase [Oligoflexus tunisiensis]|uniref:sensor histidine kinase n=1 Tax=Oligoflexus tunisiensis TaxID=708132 RepID=UPI00114CF436|nr:HAMP domain-containing sensor histidine kinase [Oligoflexus tunisiensis]
MHRLPLTFFAVLGGASLAGLGLAWLINVTLFGRPHHVLLQRMAETAAAGINCQAPQQSPLFHRNAAGNPNTANMHYALRDAQGHLLGQLGHGLPAPQENLPERGRLDNPLRRERIEVQIPNVCGRGWTLWAWDPENETYRHLLLPRQIILMASCSGAIIFVVLLAFLYMRRKGQEARQVLAGISAGALGSRLVQNFWEPRLQLIEEFNRMARAVEDSFARLHELEEKRARLLSELAHDVRTPLASLRAAAETLSEFQASMSPTQREALHQNLLLDVLYFQSLIDDLLVLAQIDRVDAPPPQQSSDLRSILTALWSRMQDAYPDRASHWEWPPETPACLMVPGDEPLLRRLLQNTLENAFHYAQSFVHGSLVLEPQRLVIHISNDTLPLSEAELQNWGHKRRHRIITEKAGQPHTSLGLGSSIIVGVSRHLGGAAWIEPIHTDSNECSQVRVIIELPRVEKHP